MTDNLKIEKKDKSKQGGKKKSKEDPVKGNKGIEQYLKPAAPKKSKEELLAEVEELKKAPKVNGKENK